MTDGKKIGCFIICQNEAANIARAVASVSELDEVVVVDSGSDDDTCKIAEAAGARVVHCEWRGFSKQKQFAMEQMQTPFVFNLDADEEASPELIKELREAAANDICALKIPRREYKFGKWESPYTRQNALVRFFQKSRAQYGSHAVHEQVIIDGKVIRAKNAIYHRGEQTIAEKTAKNLHYATLRAGERHAARRRGSVLKMIFAFPFAFFRSYILRRSFMDGWRGFANAMVNAFYAFLKEAELLERGQKRDSDEIPK